jgi:protein TonB
MRFKWVVVLAPALLLLAVDAARADEPVSELVVEMNTAATPPQVILETQRPPEFPPAALAARLSGTVVLNFKVLKDGSVAGMRVENCTHPKVGFEEAAKAAVETGRFEPATEGGAPVDYEVSYRLNFSSGGPGGPHVSAGSANQPPPDMTTDGAQARKPTAQPAPSRPQQRQR